MPNFDSSRCLVDSHQILAWNKPVGLATTGRTLEDPKCLQHQLMTWTGGMVWALHQLDKDTSGVVLFARKKRLVAIWQEKWSTASVEKFYLALVHGSLTCSRICIDAPLKRESHRGYTEVSVDDTGKKAQTIVHQLSSNGRYSLVVAHPITGRTHQLRAHLQHIGCPLIGETRYNAIPCAHHTRHALHALAIHTDEPPPLDRIEAPFPSDLRAPATRLGIDLAPLAQWRTCISDT